MNEYKVQDIIFGTKEDAEEVIYNLKKIIDDYGVVSVADLYDLSEIVGSYKDNTYGWTDINSVKTVEVTHGYSLVLPIVKKLN